MIHGRLDNHLVALSRETMQGEGDALHDAGHIAEPLPLDLPVMLVVHPGNDALIVLIRRIGITEHLVFATLTNRLDDEVGGTKVHVGHPERQ